MEFLANLSESVLWVFFLRLFCRPKRSKDVDAVGSALAVLVLMINIELADRVTAYSSYTILADFLITFLYAMIFLAEKWHWKAFLSLIFVMGLVISSFLGVNFYMNVLKLDAETVLSGNGLWRAVVLVSAKTLLVLWFLLAAKWKEKISVLKQLGIHILLLPLLAVITILTLAEVLNRFYRQTTDVLWLIWLMLFIALLFFECTQMGCELYKGRKDREMMELLKHEMAIQQEVHQQQYENIRKVRKTQHDMKHKLVVIEQLLLRRQYEKAQAYTGKLLAELDEIPSFRYGDSLVSTLLSIKEESARKYDIPITIDAQIMTTERIPEPELCMILGNLLDNAIEAEKELDEREIRVLLCEQMMLYICVENVVEDRRETAVIRKGYTTRKDAALHGFGMACIEEIVQKWNGSLEVTQEGGWFRAEILL